MRSRPDNLCLSGLANRKSNYSMNRKRKVSMTDKRFDPPLDLEPPKGKEAEWALLRLAEMCGVERSHDTWQELADKIAESMSTP